MLFNVEDELHTAVELAAQRRENAERAVPAVNRTGARGTVAVAGLLGFVGLIAPHIVRIVIGSDNRFLLPCSALFGALLVTACDTAGRLVIEPSELPAGILMALLGPPFFLWLLRGCRYEA